MWSAIEQGRILQAMVGVLPLALWSLCELRAKGDWQRGLIAGLATGLVGSVYLYWGYALIVFAVLWCPWRRAWKESGWWTMAVVGGGIALWNLSHLDGGYLSTQASMTVAFPSLEMAFSPAHFDEAGAILESALPIGWWVYPPSTVSPWY